MRTRAATSGLTVDAVFTQPAHAATQVHAGQRQPSPSALAELQRDAVALTWDLTIHQLHQAFARCMDTPPTELQDATAARELAQTRLAAARHAIDDIQAALSRMARGTYGRCQQCKSRITTERLQASPTARWCAACHAQQADELPRRHAA